MAPEGGYVDLAVTDEAPPPPQEEVVGVAPGPGYFWIGGVWFWEGGRHVWHPGHWEAGAEKASAMVPHHWDNEAAAGICGVAAGASAALKQARIAAEQASSMAGRKGLQKAAIDRWSLRPAFDVMTDFSTGVFSRLSACRSRAANRGER